MESSASENDLWVFRDARKSVSGKQLLDELRCAAQDLAGPKASPSSLVDTLIRSGELEATLADAGCAAASQLATLTDALASALHESPQQLATVRSTLSVPVPDQLTMSPPEGFSYYALHPMDFSGLALRVGTNGRPAAVVGIRSIGTTLSAVVAAALKTTGVPVKRITVRPTGHPYSRSLEFTGSQLSWIKAQLAMDSTFLVVDEGPGRSGSTFLSVAEALMKAGVGAEGITMLGSRQPDISQLCSENGALRWSSFRFAAVKPDSHAEFHDFTYVGGGEWRRFFLKNGSEWPVCWPQMERLKFLSPDGRRLWKFEGLGRFGEAVGCCSRHLAAAGYGAEAQDADGGFMAYEVVDGPVLRAEDISQSLLDRIASYCAFRTGEFRLPNASPDPLAQMLTFNVEREFGVELQLRPEELESSALVLTDGRMQPHEWIMNPRGTATKTDACAHGDDHFFPGPCDIAWDLAGAAVEWNLSSDATEHLLSRFHRLTGDDVTKRFPAYALAYNVFRLAWCKMAISTVTGTDEESRIHQAYLAYRKRAHDLLCLRQPQRLQSVAS